MIDTWFNNDIQEVFSKHSVVVFIDESGAAEFLLKSLDKDCTVHYVSNDVDELKAKEPLNNSPLFAIIAASTIF